jgi:membrane-anchored protein YejM (alkaline phosphatase superfamily)
MGDTFSLGLAGSSGGAVGRGFLVRWAAWFWFLVATLSMLIGTRYPLVAGLPQETQGVLFLGLLTLSHWYVLYFLLTWLLFVPLLLLLPFPRLLRGVAVVSALLLLLLLVVDLVSFTLFRFHLNGLVFSLLFGGAGDEIFVFDWQLYLYALLGLLLALAAVLWLDRVAWRIAARRGARGGGYRLALLLCAAFVAQNFWFAWADAAGWGAITAQARTYPGYTPTRAAREFRALGLVDTAAASPRVASASGVVNYPRQPLICHPPAPLPNIFMVVVDSWRYDEISEAVTPHIARFAREAIPFPRHYSGGNNTRTGLFSLFYGLPATYWESFLDARAGAVLVNAMQDAGYQLAIYASAKLTGPEFDRTIFADVPRLRKETLAETVMGRDELANSEFIASLQQRDGRPLFGFLFYDAPHSFAYSAPYQDHFKPSASGVNYFALTRETDPTPLRNLYRNSLKSVDALVGEAFAAIRGAGLWENSIVIVTADHGQEFNDNGLGFWGHNGNFTDAQIRVPLLIKWPGRGAPSARRLTTHYDIAPTLLGEVLGCENETDDYSVGRSLFSAGEGREKGFVVGGFGDFGVRLEEQIVWVDKFGGIQVLSADNRLLQQPPDPGALRQALEQNSQFLR